jgi:hypothetical protein
MWEKDITITRKDEFCDISEIRNDAGVKNLSNFQKYQKVFLDEVKKEIGDEPIKTNGNTTLIHEKILERVLRWYELPETEVIDKFVHPQSRVVGQYKYNKVEILVHLESKYVNGSKFCPLFGKPMHRWMDLKGTKEILKHYADHHKIESTEIIKKGLEYDSGDIWIPQNLLPMLAIWCSPKYAIFVSDVMNLFHTDPMKLAAMAVQEHDRQTGTKTTAFFKSTDDDDEHAENLKKQIEDLELDLEGKNATIFDQAGKIITLEELKKRQVILIQRLKDNVYMIKYEKELLLKDNRSLESQFAPVRALMNDHPGIEIDHLALTRKAMLDKNMYPLEKELAEKDVVIKTLQEQLQAERKEKDEAYDELSIAQGTHDEEARDRDEYIEQLESGCTFKKKKKKATKATKATKFPKAFRPEATFELEGFDNNGIASAAPPGSCSHLSVYTKRDYDGKNMFAFVPGRSTNYKGLMFIMRGVIKLDEKKTAEQYLESFTDDNRNAYTKHEGLTFTLDPSHNAESFERLFCKGVSEHVVSKQTATEYKIGNKDAVCSY